VGSCGSMGSKRRLNCSVSAAIRLKTPHALLGYGELIVNIYAVASCLFFLAVSQWVTARGGLPARAALSLSRASFGIYLSHPPGTCDMEALDRYGQSRPFPSIGVGWGCSSPCRIVVRDCHAQADKVGLDDRRQVVVGELDRPCALPAGRRVFPLGIGPGCGALLFGIGVKPVSLSCQREQLDAYEEPHGSRNGAGSSFRWPLEAHIDP